MDEKKKPEANGEETERLGPYVLQEQVPQSDESQGELYLARNETSGAAALVLKHAPEEGGAPWKDWRVRLISWGSLGYCAMEVEHTPWSRAQDRQSVESLVHTLEGVLEGVRRMTRAWSGPQEPRFRWRLGLGLASAATVCALLFALVRVASVSQPPSAPTAPMSLEDLMATEVPEPFIERGLVDTTPPQEQTVLARPLPKEPYKGQKRPPCTRYTEVELVGACWIPHELKPPCPESLHEHQGKCYLPAFSAKPPPQSLGQ
ncbi:MAG TPA: hypothetical protein VFZ09_21370 [Archangium sp.]|uniref:hypothetical protein n=1 Tax=Archangium sp. TaxID=1872627 RepID=UPI002E3264D7|nr:hypothetical protein [Archangium sp.]HEX5748806.1 hypothetical protein [Archangium sp.]